MNKIQRDKFKRKVLKKLEYKLRFYTYVLQTINNSIVLKSSQFYVNNLFKNKVVVRNHCFLTMQSSSVYRKFKLSRIQIRILCNKKALPGLHKAS